MTELQQEQRHSDKLKGTKLVEPNVLKRLGQNDSLNARFWIYGVERHVSKTSILDSIPIPCWLFLGWILGILTMIWLTPVIRGA